MHEHHLSAASPAGAWALIALLAVVVAALAVGTLKRKWGVLALGAAVTGGVFQFGHVGEHVLQAGYWVGHRADPPWMTPWASALGDSFARLAPAVPGFGMEAMHLTGNAIFLAAAAALLVFVRRTVATGSPRPVQRIAVFAVIVQAVHVVEHVALTATLLAGGPPRGVSTLFGTLQAGPTLWTYRVWWHLTINIVGTAAFGVAAARAHRRDEQHIQTTHSPALA